jgi:uncharacterized membrane-anchored protein YitT (DUF2179 family)
VLALNAAILMAGGGLMGLETLVYSLLFLAIYSHAIDALVGGPTSLRSELGCHGS